MYSGVHSTEAMPNIVLIEVCNSSNTVSSIGSCTQVLASQVVPMLGYWHHKLCPPKKFVKQNYFEFCEVLWNFKFKVSKHLAKLKVILFYKLFGRAQLVVPIPKHRHNLWCQYLGTGANTWNSIRTIAYFYQNYIRHCFCRVYSTVHCILISVNWTE